MGTELESHPESLTDTSTETDQRWFRPMTCTGSGLHAVHSGVGASLIMLGQTFMVVPDDVERFAFHVGVILRAPEGPPLRPVVIVDAKDGSEGLVMAQPGDVIHLIFSPDELED